MQTATLTAQTVVVYMLLLLSIMFRARPPFTMGFRLPQLRDGVGSRRFTSRSGGRKSVSAEFVGKPVDEAVLSEGVITHPPKGTRDFYPADVSMRNWLHSHWKRTAHRFGFEEYDAPILESEQLYVRKAGEEITDQLYNFVDKGERRVSLRPEMTPSLARMVLSKGTSLALPLKWFSVPQCWRYEQMSRGRRREHYQWNMDIWGVPGVQAEAELIAAAVSCMASLGLSSIDVGIKVNNRKLLNEVMQAAGVPSALWAPVCVVVDKRDKLPQDAVEKLLSDLGLSAATVATLLSHLGARNISEVEGVLGRESEGVAELTALLSLLRDGYGIGEEWVSFDFSVVRGLSYYTGTVFEGADKAGKLRAICGGGRYDNLFQTMGGQRAIPAAGFGFGDAVIMELLAEKGLAPLLDLSAADVVVFAWEESLRCRATAIASQLRTAGMRVDLVLEEGKRLKAVLQRANKTGASALVMLAPEEDSLGTLVVRDLRQGSQTTQKYADLIASVGTIVGYNLAPPFET